MINPNDLFYLLSQHIDSLGTRYIVPHTTNLLSKPTDYDNDIKAYCVLAHAAFEGFIEGIALFVLEESISKYVNHQIITKPIVSLLLHYGDRTKVREPILKFDKWSSQNTSFVLNNSIQEAKVAHSHSINNNHGFSIDYFCNILLPVSIDIPSDMVLQNSVDRLKKLRGDYAHNYQKSGSLITSTSPSDASDIVYDCLRFCEIIKDNANQSGVS